MKPRPVARATRAIAFGLLLAGSFSSLGGDAPGLPPLSTISANPRLPGKFVWADLVTDDVAAVRPFYGRLFGWTFRDLGGYAIASNQDRPLCGMFQKPKPADRQEAKPRWFGYISVGNVERAKTEVTKAGGKVLAAPRKYPKRGEQAVFADPEGAVFGVVKSSSGDPADFLPEPGDWIWAQFLSRDARQAAEFYRAVAGYEIVEIGASNRVAEYVLTSKGYARATLRTIPSRLENVKPNWLPFVRVKSIAESLEQTRQLGGKVLFEPRSELFDGRVAVIADPTGAAIGILEWQEGMLRGGR